MGHMQHFPVGLSFSAPPPWLAASLSAPMTMLHRPPRPPMAIRWPSASDPTPSTFNPWVEISPEKITLIAQHADIGQGVGSVQPIMIAEEMDLDPGQFEIRFAGPSPAYFNTGFADELAPFLAADQSPAAEEARAAALEASGSRACR